VSESSEVVGWLVSSDSQLLTDAVIALDSLSVNGADRGYVTGVNSLNDNSISIARTAAHRPTNEIFHLLNPQVSVKITPIFVIGY
jgi:hypothetical protein